MADTQTVIDESERIREGDSARDGDVAARLAAAPEVLASITRANAAPSGSLVRRPRRQRRTGQEESRPTSGTGPVTQPKRAGDPADKPQQGLGIDLPPIDSEDLKHCRSTFPVRYTHDEDGTPLMAVALHASGGFLDADDEDDLVFVDGED